MQNKLNDKIKKNKTKLNEYLDKTSENVLSPRRIQGSKKVISSKFNSFIKKINNTKSTQQIQNKEPNPDKISTKKQNHVFVSTNKGTNGRNSVLNQGHNSKLTSSVCTIDLTFEEPSKLSMTGLSTTKYAGRSVSSQQSLFSPTRSTNKKKTPCKICDESHRSNFKLEQQLKSLKIETAQKIAKYRKEHIQDRKDLQKMSRLLMDAEDQKAQLIEKNYYLIQKTDIQFDQIQQLEQDAKALEDEGSHSLQLKQALREQIVEIHQLKNSLKNLQFQKYKLSTKNQGYINQIGASKVSVQTQTFSRKTTSKCLQTISDFEFIPQPEKIQVAPHNLQKLDLSLMKRTSAASTTYGAIGSNDTTLNTSKDSLPRQLLKQKMSTRRKRHVQKAKIDISEPLGTALSAQHHLLEKLEKLDNQDAHLRFLIGSFKSERDKLDEIYIKQNFYNESDSDEEIDKIQSDQQTNDNTFFDKI